MSFAKTHFVQRKVIIIYLTATLLIYFGGELLYDLLTNVLPHKIFAFRLLLWIPLHSIQLLLLWKILDENWLIRSISSKTLIYGVLIAILFILTATDVFEKPQFFCGSCESPNKIHDSITTLHQTLEWVDFFRMSTTVLFILRLTYLALPNYKGT